LNPRKEASTVSPDTVPATSAMGRWEMKRIGRGRGPSSRPMRATRRAAGFTDDGNNAPAAPRCVMGAKPPTDGIAQDRAHAGRGEGFILPQMAELYRTFVWFIRQIESSMPRFKNLRGVFGWLAKKAEAEHTEGWFLIDGSAQDGYLMLIESCTTGDVRRDGPGYAYVGTGARPLVCSAQS
jgi:hypothetical protein